MTDACAHTTVLLQEAVAALGLIEPAHGATEPTEPIHAEGVSMAARSQGQYVDATYGRGGHSALILNRLGRQGRLTALDKDPQAVAHAQTISDARFQVRHASFTTIGDWPEASLDGVLMDLGVSSPQIDQAERGFSFRRDGPLDMRMDSSQGESVADWLARADAQEIAQVIRDYGEERFARPIAQAIVQRRQEQGPLMRTLELAQLVARVVKTREAGQDPATRTFQALRIFINGELQDLAQALDVSLRALREGGRLVVISFHSLEDRLVKNFMAQHGRESFDRRAPFAPPKPLLLQGLARIKPSAQEVAGNPRARSAILRVAERSATPWSPALAVAPQRRAA